MARPYSAGGVSRAQSNPTCRRPAAAAACGLQHFSGPTFPPCSRRHPYCFRQQSHRIWGGREGAGERAGPGGPLSCIRILEEDFIPLHLERQIGLAKTSRIALDGRAADDTICRRRGYSPKKVPPLLLQPAILKSIPCGHDAAGFVFALVTPRSAREGHGEEQGRSD